MVLIRSHADGGEYTTMYNVSPPQSEPAVEMNVHGKFDTTATAITRIICGSTGEWRVEALTPPHTALLFVAEGGCGGIMEATDI